MKNDNAKQNYRINEQIKAREVRVVGEGIETQVLPLAKAISLAHSMDQDLVEISATANPPVCRVIDYSKFLYQQKKKQKEMKARQVKISVKEIRFGPQTDDHDYDFKLKHAKEFLEAGNKVKAYVFFRGRSIVFKEQGEVLLLRFANDLEEVGKVEQMPSLLGKRMIMFLAPKKMPGSGQKKPTVVDETPVKKNQSLGKPEQKVRKEYTGPKVEGEDFDD